MTYIARKQPRLFFDLECAARPESFELMPEPKAPANLKDPEKIKAAIDEKRRELIDTAALDPDYGKILSIGYSIGIDMPVTAMMVGDPVCVDWDEDGNETVFKDLTETDLINDFWGQFMACNGSCIGYNILGFDLPYLMRRSMALGVKVPYLPNLAKFRTEPVTDLMMILYNWGSDRYKGLKQVAKLYGIQNECPDVDGSKVKDLDRDTLRAYQISDVKLVQALYQKMNGIYFNH